MWKVQAPNVFDLVNATPTQQNDSDGCKKKENKGGNGGG